MTSRKNVQNTHMSAEHRALHMALLEIVGVLNEPQRDEALIAAAGVRLDRALFPLLIGIERFGPIGVVELADGVNRDHTTVSRQLAKLESLNLIRRIESLDDRRTRRAIVTAEGKAMSGRIDAARERMFRAIFRDWPPGEVTELTRLMGKLAAAMREGPVPSDKKSVTATARAVRTGRRNLFR
jgi:DNA-binding MarR family transcriptional regulator